MKIIIGFLILFLIIFILGCIEEPTPTSNGGASNISNNVSSDNKTEINITPNITGKKYAIIASGASHDEQHNIWYWGSTSGMYYVLKDNYSYSDEDVYFLFEYPEKDNSIVDYKSTKANFIKVLDEIISKIKDDDQVFMYLVGHGASSGQKSYYELADIGIYDYELGTKLEPVKARVIVVLTPCSVGGFIDDLSGENKITITSTRADESNKASFAELIRDAFKKKYDENNDGKTSFTEAYNYAVDGVVEWYEYHGYSTISEHALLDDNGDGTAVYGKKPANGDGYLASQTFLEK